MLISCSYFASRMGEETIYFEYKTIEKPSIVLLRSRPIHGDDERWNGQWQQQWY